MDWRKIVVILLLSSCNSMRSIVMCRIRDDASSMLADCAVKDKKYTLHYPEEMQKFACWDDIAMEDLGSAISECEINGNAENPWEDMNVKHIPCGDSLVGFWCTDPIGEKKIKERLEYCERSR